MSHVSFARLKADFLSFSVAVSLISHMPTRDVLHQQQHMCRRSCSWSDLTSAVVWSVSRCSDADRPPLTDRCPLCRWTARAVPLHRPTVQGDADRLSRLASQGQADQPASQPGRPAAGLSPDRRSAVAPTVEPSGCRRAGLNRSTRQQACQQDLATWLDRLDAAVDLAGPH